jgi:hypothetical protein
VSSLVEELQRDADEVKQGRHEKTRAAKGDGLGAEREAWGEEEGIRRAGLF